MFFSRRIGVDEWLRVPSVKDVFSIGDCSGFVESTGRPTLPALAQVSDIRTTGRPTLSCHVFTYRKHFLIPYRPFIFSYTPLQKVCFCPFDAIAFGFHRWQKDRVNI